jgi:hypothetical protein
MILSLPDHSLKPLATQLAFMGKKGKKKVPGTETKRGAPDHFTGFKRSFLDSQVLLYQQALDHPKSKEKTKEFYNKIVRDFIAKFGDSEPFSLEPEEDPPAPSENTATTEYTDEEEAAKATARYTKLRTVSILVAPLHTDLTHLQIRSWLSGTVANINVRKSPKHHRLTSTLSHKSLVAPSPSLANEAPSTPTRSFIMIPALKRSTNVGMRWPNINITI